MSAPAVKMYGAKLAPTRSELAALDVLAADEEALWDPEDEGVATSLG
jgi:hypothetical protein